MRHPVTRDQDRSRIAARKGKRRENGTATPPAMRLLPPGRHHVRWPSTRREAQSRSRRPRRSGPHPSPAPGGQGPDRRPASANPTWQPLDADTIHAAQRRDRHTGGARQRHPAHRPQCPPARMAARRKHRRQEYQHRPGPARPPQLYPIMRRRCDDPPGDRHRRHAAAAAQMLACPQPGRESRVARDHQDKPPDAAQPCHVQPQRKAIRRAIMPEHNPGAAFRQPGNRRTWVRQPLRIGEQPQRRDDAAPDPRRPHRTRPGQQTGIHRGSCQDGRHSRGTRHRATYYIHGRPTPRPLPTRADLRR